ncbi:MAG: transporter substrate-binding domain-containing protein [Balneolaceae bacterium]|nr:transporter substrate-binding domain-containing protein [Balneolaceae bacterium]
MDHASAQQESDEVVIGTRVVPPFVIEEGGEYSGLSVTLWDHIADEMDIDYRFEETDIQGMLDGVKDGSYYASISALTVTSEREATVDFTHPYYISGLGIAVSYQPVGLWQSLLAVFSTDFLWVVFLLIVLLLFWGVLIWFFERKNNPEEFGGNTAEGIGNGFWWAAVTMTTVGYGDKSPRSLGGRIIGFIWMFAAIIVISFFTASIASSLTVNQLESRVSGPQDLPNVRVGALENSATVVFLDSEEISSSKYPSIEDGLLAVENNEIDAFVHDAPIIGYYINQEFQNRVQMLPNSFNKQYYGIVLPSNSDIRNQVNQIILEYINSDEWLDLIEQYE